ncbi:hypothetical protein GLAREA_09133 [Glarea lozoyensis ATCC 20868]|uniref:Uncharacterized protein n=1 Tax=Glarea lozoyensis (strain ATCC 20868 / MF5171) TaxID=1116229 RepID=S3DGY4_GLAL2|nr:uncharacterized protein GLAREA_09133 [Glarea lozoyensis ATCC 20868]EPE36970.1 hypothetical protein GLAREA_09133 [Glarea lozoyensis ATCC 20868]
MKFFSIITAALLPLVAISSPLNAVRDFEAEAAAKALAVKTSNNAHKVRDLDAEAAGLIKRGTKYCDIVHVSTEVDCWWLPKHNGNGNHKVRSFAGTANNIKFTCYTNCEDVHGNTSWDWADDYNCYVPGYYTDNTCSRGI